MSAAGTATGSCGPGPGSVATGSASGSCNPRKFSEKIALHTQRQAEETAAFQEVMSDITSTRIQVQKVHLACNQDSYYGGSLPNVNQIGRINTEFQLELHSNLDSTRHTRHHGLVERVQRDRRLACPGAPYRRRFHRECSAYNPAFLPTPPDPIWRRHWSPRMPMDRSLSMSLPVIALSRTNSDSALHTKGANALPGHHSSSNRTLKNQSTCTSFPYPVPPIEENVLDEENPLKPLDTKMLPMSSIRPKSCEVPHINIFTSPDQQPGAPLIPTTLSTGGSLPDLSSLHYPSPLPAPLDVDEAGYPSLSAGSSTGNLAATLTQLGITKGNSFHLPGLSSALQATFENPGLQSSLSHPNIQTSLSCLSHRSSSSLQSLLSNPSLQSSLSSSPSLLSSLSNQSLPSSLSNSSLSGKSLQSAASNPSCSSGIGRSASCSSSSGYSPFLTGQQGPPLSMSPRRRNQHSPLIMPASLESRWHLCKQYSPPKSSTLSSITQGVALDTYKPVDQKLLSYPYGQELQSSHSAPALPQESHHAGLQHQQHPHQKQQYLQLSSLQKTDQQQLHLQQEHHQPQNQPGLQHQHLYHEQQQDKQEEIQYKEFEHVLQLHQERENNQQHVQQEKEQQHWDLYLHQEEQQKQHQCVQHEPVQQHHLNQQQQHHGPEQQGLLQCMQTHPQTQHYHSENIHGPSNLQIRPCEQTSRQLSSPSHSCGWLQPPGAPALQKHRNLPSKPTDLEQQDPSLLSSLLAEPCTSLQLLTRNNQDHCQQGWIQTEMPVEQQSFNQNLSSNTSKVGPYPLGSRCTSVQQILNEQNQSPGYSGGCYRGPSMLSTGNSTSGWSKEITSALSGMPGFEMDPFDLDDPLKMDPSVLEGLGLLEDGELVLADPSVEDSFRSDRFL